MAVDLLGPLVREQGWHELAGYLGQALFRVGRAEESLDCPRPALEGYRAAAEMLAEAVQRDGRSDPGRRTGAGLRPRVDPGAGPGKPPGGRDGRPAGRRAVAAAGRAGRTAGMAGAAGRFPGEASRRADGCRRR
jgi:hypothetical protein